MARSHRSRTTPFGAMLRSPIHGFADPPHVEHVVDLLPHRLGVLDLLQLLDALLVLDAGGLHLGHRLVLGLVLLRHEHRHRVVDHGLDQGEHGERVALVVPIEQGDGVEQERGEQLVEGEVVLQVVVDLDEAAVLVGCVEQPHDAGGAQRLVEADGRAHVAPLARPGLVAVEQQRAAVGPRVAGSVEQLHQHPRRHPERRLERLGLGVLQLRERLLVVVHEALRRLGLLELASSSSGRRRPWPGRPRSRRRAPGARAITSPAVSYPARPARPAIWWNSRRRQHPGLGAVVLVEAGEHDGADRQVDARRRACRCPR